MTPNNASNPNNNDGKKKRRRIGLLLSSMANIFLFVGAFFGYGPMQLLFEENGHFSWRCTPQERAENFICSAQSSTLIQVQLVGQITQIFSPLLGIMVDRYGAIVTAYCMSICGSIGVGLIVLVSSFRDAVLDWFLYVAFSFLGIATWCGALLIVQVALYFADPTTRARIIFVLNALFDAGSITYLGLWGLDHVTGANLTVTATFYLVLAIVVYGLTCYFWTVAVPATQQPQHSPGCMIQPGEDYQESAAAAAAETTSDDPEEKQLRSTEEMQQQQDNPHNSSESDDDDNRMNDLEKEKVVEEDRSLFQELTSAPFLLLAIFWTIHVTANQWTLSTTRDFLASLGDNKVNNRYLQIFTLMMPVSLAGLPFIDFVVKHHGLYGGLQAVNVLALGYNVVRLVGDDLNVQIVGFVLFSFFRCFLFGVSFSLLANILPHKVVGKAAGILYALTGLTAFFNIPLSDIAVRSGFFVPNMVYTCLSLLCFVAAYLLGKILQQQQQQAS